MAHVADTQIQAHSAGPLFPFVIGRRECNGRRTWEITGPKVTIVGCQSYEEATTIIHLLQRGQYIAPLIDWDEATETCSDCGAKVAYIIGCPDGAEICQDCFDAGNH